MGGHATTAVMKTSIASIFLTKVMVLPFKYSVEMYHELVDSETVTVSESQLL